jgi:urea transport system substrate-binding protein
MAEPRDVGRVNDLDPSPKVTNPHPTESTMQAMGQTVALHGVASPPEVPPEFVDHPRYRILELLGAGGMGSVFKAEDTLMQRLVALKVLGKELTKDAEAVARFRREVTLAARVSHPNIVTAHDAGQAGELHFLVMEFVQGKSLSDLIEERGPLPVAEACEYVRQAAIGLQHAYERGMVHRDIKPSNLIVTADGQVKLLDLGLARLTAERSGGKDLTTRQQVLGTLDYMAPEQWDDSHGVDIRADIYSLGCTLYDLLTGQPPFADSRYESVLKKMKAHADVPPPPVHERRADVPAELSAVLDRMLAKNRLDRYQTPAEVAQALAPFTVRGPVTGRPRGLTAALLAPLRSRLAGKPSRLRGLLVAAAAAALLLVGAWLDWYFLSDHSSPPAAAVLDDSNPIKVGVVYALSGPMKISEEAVQEATLLAIDEINQNGGLLGRKVEPIVVDTQSNPDVPRQAVERLITQDRVCTVFGFWTSRSRKNVKPLFEKHDHLLIYPVQYEGLEQSPNIVYTGAAPNQQIIPAVRWCLGNLGNKFFLVGSDYVFPRAANAIIRDEVESKGGLIVGEDYLLTRPALGDVEKVVQKIVASQPQVILNTINGAANVAFFAELRRAGITPAKIPTVSFSIGENELRELGFKHMVGDYAAWNYFMSVKTPENEAFIRKFQARYGKHRLINDPMESAYFGVHLWAQAVRQANSDDVRAIRQAIRGQKMQAPEGPVQIDPDNQHAWKIYRLGQIGPEGQFQIKDRSEDPLAPMPYPASRTPQQWQQFLDDLYQKWGQRWENPGQV